MRCGRLGGLRASLLRESSVLINQKPQIKATWIRDNIAHDEARYHVRVFERDARVFDAQILLMAKGQAKPSPEEKIDEWVRQHPLPESGAVENYPHAGSLVGRGSLLFRSPVTDSLSERRYIEVVSMEPSLQKGAC